MAARQLARGDRGSVPASWSLRATCLRDNQTNAPAWALDMFRKDATYFLSFPFWITCDLPIKIMVKKAKSTPCKSFYPIFHVSNGCCLAKGLRCLGVNNSFWRLLGV